MRAVDGRLCFRDTGWRCQGPFLDGTGTDRRLGNDIAMTPLPLCLRPSKLLRRTKLEFGTKVAVMV